MANVMELPWCHIFLLPFQFTLNTVTLTSREIFASSSMSFNVIDISGQGIILDICLVMKLYICPSYVVIKHE